MKKAFIVLLVFALANFVMAESQIDEALQGLNSKDWSIRVKSTIILGRAKDCRAVKPLINALGDENYYVREWAQNALIQIGEPSFDLLTGSLRDIDWRVRKRAAYALGEINDGNAVSFLANALRDTDSHVVNMAKNSLIKIGVPAIESVIALLNDKNIKVQKNAGYILSQIGNPVVEPLINELKGNDWYAAVETIFVLGEIGDNRAIEPLFYALKNENKFVRFEAISALSKIGDSKIVEFITPMLNDEDGRVRDKTKEVMKIMINNKKEELSVTAFKN